MACNSKKETGEKGYKTPQTKLASDKMTPEVLWSFGRVGSPSVSPDGQTAVFGITYFNKEENRSYSDLYTMNIADGKMIQITDTKDNEHSATWTPDGKKIAYVQKGQLWEMNPDGSNIKQITDIEGGIEGFLYAPDMSK
ncbi:DPP IV N-terminal domain-containing protein, partial [Porphyromonadaceae bacterium OttesenSCG-928-L07]|nr:DPP IV N-terminal domain-containing protein [Porphyromonadaceae bacterium OttesenSCG-928-L07]